MFVKKLLLAAFICLAALSLSSCAGDGSTSEDFYDNRGIYDSTYEAEDHVITVSAPADIDLPFSAEVTYPYKPFEGKTISCINIHCKYDLYDPVEISAEDTEILTEMLGRVELVGEKMDTRKLKPYSGKSPASFTIFFEDGEIMSFSAESDIGYPDGTDGGAYIIDGDYYAVDKQTVCEITDFYHDVLLDKYIPEYRVSYSPDTRDLESSESQEPDDGTDDAFMPFAKTGASEYVYIEILPSGLEAALVEPARLSDEEAERVFELMRQIRIDTPPLNEHTWWGSPDGGYGPEFLVSHHFNAQGDYINTIPVILGGSVVEIYSIQFLTDEEIVSELCELHDELFRKYYPDIAAKWDAIENQS